MKRFSTHKLEKELKRAERQKEWLKKVSEIVKKPDVKWFTTNAFNNKKPGLARFVGLEFFYDKKGLLWRANALGDSFLFYAPQKIRDFEKDIFKLFRLYQLDQRQRNAQKQRMLRREEILSNLNHRNNSNAQCQVITKITKGIIASTVDDQKLVWVITTTTVER